MYFRIGLRFAQTPRLLFVLESIPRYIIFLYRGTKISFQSHDVRNSVKRKTGKRAANTCLRPEAKLRKRRYTGYHIHAFARNCTFFLQHIRRTIIGAIGKITYTARDVTSEKRLRVIYDIIYSSRRLFILPLYLRTALENLVYRRIATKCPAIKIEMRVSPPRRKNSEEI